MRCHVDNIIRPWHYMHITFFIDHASIASVNPLSSKPFHIAPIEPLLIFEQRHESARCQRDSQYDIAHCSWRHLPAFVIDDSDIKTGHRLSCCSSLDLRNIHHSLAPLPFFCNGSFQWPQGYSRNRTPTFGTPPIINHSCSGGSPLLQQLLVQLHDARLAPLTRQEQAPQAPQAALSPSIFKMLVPRVISFDRPQGCWRCE